MLVEVVHATRDSFQPTIVAAGTVQAAQEVLLNPQVSGRVVEHAPEFVPGGYVEEGQTLLRIDPTDYRNTLKQRQGALRQVMADLELEMGRQDIAEEEYALLDRELSRENAALVLREPQLEAVRGRIRAAEASVAQAELDLRRTTIKAPFNAHILSRDVNVGSQVSVSDTLAHLVGVDVFWVAVAVPLDKLRWVSLPESPKGEGSRVELRNRTAWPEGAVRRGHVYRLIAALGERTRMARILIEVPDPLARRTTPSPEGPPLMIGEFLEASIHGKELVDVVRLDRDFLRKGDTVWTMEGGRLRIRKVEVVVRDPVYAYLSRGLDEQHQVVTTNLATVTEGARLRVEKPGLKE